MRSAVALDAHGSVMALYPSDRVMVNLVAFANFIDFYYGAILNLDTNGHVTFLAHLRYSTLPSVKTPDNLVGSVRVCGIAE